MTLLAISSSTVTELIGYLASLLVVISLAMSSVVRLRLISLAGAVTFIIYGVLIGAIPILVANAVIAGLNIWFLTRELSGKRDLGAVEVADHSPFLVDFLSNHAAAIKEFQPSFDATAKHDFALVLTRDGLPAGVVLGSRDGTTLNVELDYVLAAYRDSRLGQWLFGAGSSMLRKAGFERVVSTAGGSAHQTYLHRVGFDHDTATDRYVREL